MSEDKTPRIPLIVEPIGKKDYPRIEVFVDNLTSTIGLRNESDEKLKHVAYCAPTAKGILRMLDEKIFHEKMLAKKEKSFKANLKSFMTMVKQHNTQIMKLATDIEEVTK